MWLFIFLLPNVHWFPFCHAFVPVCLAFKMCTRAYMCLILRSTYNFSNVVECIQHTQTPAQTRSMKKKRRKKTIATTTSTTDTQDYSLVLLLFCLLFLFVYTIFVVACAMVFWLSSCVFGSHLFRFLLTSTSISSTDRWYTLSPSHSFLAAVLIFSSWFWFVWTLRRIAYPCNLCVACESFECIYVWAFKAKTNKIGNNKKSEIAVEIGACEFISVSFLFFVLVRTEITMLLYKQCRRFLFVSQPKYNDDEKFIEKLSFTHPQHSARSKNYDDILTYKTKKNKN